MVKALEKNPTVCNLHQSKNAKCILISNTMHDAGVKAMSDITV